MNFIWASCGVSSARERAEDHEWLGTAHHRVRERRIGRFVGQVLRAGEEAHVRAPLLRGVIADRAAQHRIRRLERIEGAALRDRLRDLELHLVDDVRERAQVRRQHDADHRSVWTSTESTGGRSRTIALQWSPASADTYTWPPLVPKYTPHGSSASTAIASRSTFT